MFVCSRLNIVFPVLCKVFCFLFRFVTFFKSAVSLVNPDKSYAMFGVHSFARIQEIYEWTINDVQVLIQ